MITPTLKAPVSQATRPAVGRRGGLDPFALFAAGQSLVLDFRREIYGTNPSAVYPGASLVLNFQYQDYRLGDAP